MVLRGRAPLLPRVAAVPGSGAEVVFVGGAAGPLGGDDLAVRIEVGAGARLTVRSAAASVVLPGTGAAARQRVEIDVEDGGELAWLPEPVVVAAGARYESAVRVTLGRATRLLMRETLVLGRAFESCGDAVSRWDVSAEGRVLLRQQAGYGPGAKPGWRGPAGTCGGTVVGTELRYPDVPDLAPRLPSVPGRAVCALAGGGRLTTVVAGDTLRAEQLMAGEAGEAGEAGASEAEPTAVAGAMITPGKGGPPDNNPRLPGPAKTISVSTAPVAVDETGALPV